MSKDSPCVCCLPVSCLTLRLFVFQRQERFADRSQLEMEKRVTTLFVFPVTLHDLLPVLIKEQQFLLYESVHYLLKTMYFFCT